MIQNCMIGVIGISALSGGFFCFSIHSWAIGMEYAKVTNKRKSIDSLQYTYHWYSSSHFYLSSCCEIERNWNKSTELDSTDMQIKSIELKRKKPTDLSDRSLCSGHQIGICSTFTWTNEPIKHHAMKCFMCVRVLMVNTTVLGQ